MKFYARLTVLREAVIFLKLFIGIYHFNMASFMFYENLDEFCLEDCNSE